VVSLNHVISRIWWHTIEQLSVMGVSAFAKTSMEVSKIIIEMVKFMITMLSPALLTPDATELRDNEYAADCLAIQFTGDPNSAMTCFHKLSGGNLANPSHIWELFGINIPAMSFNDRITELRKCVRQHFPSFTQ
jgi:hypothetical protein